MAQVLASSQHTHGQAHTQSLGRRHIALAQQQQPSSSKPTRKHHRVNSSGTKFLSLSGSSGSKKRIKALSLCADTPREHKPAAAAAAASAGADADNMASSFLQFCPVCDKQLATPSTATLYCSARCRQEDTNSNQNPSDVSLPLTFLRSSSLPSYTITTPDFDAMSTRVVPERAPSTLSSLDVTTPSTSNGAEQTTAAGSRGRRRQLSAEDFRSTAAMSFLAQFHNSPTDMYVGYRQRASSRSGVARTAREPSLDHSNGSTPVESLPGSPSSLKRLGSGSQGSLRSLAPSIQSPSAPEMSDSDGLEVGKPVTAVRDRNIERTLQGNAARESLIRMLGES